MKLAIIQGFLSMILLVNVAITYGQGSFEAFVDAKQVLLDGFVEVEFVLKEADGVHFRRPSFEGFRVISGPARSSSTSIINGQVSKEVSYAFTLQPTRLGKMKIGPATINVEGERLSTKPLVVEVVQGKRNPIEEGQQVFIRAEPSLLEVNVGQQIILDYRLYTSVNVETYNIVEESNYASFFATDIRRHDARIVKEVINGQQYTTKVIKRVALFAQQTGALQIDPLHVQLGISSESGRRSSFIFGRELKRIVVSSKPVEINVLPLPANAPPSFSGAVGKWEMSIQFNRNTITTDDALSVRMVLTGDGDVKRVQIPEMQWPPSFEEYDPRVVNETVAEKNGQLIGQKEIEYLAVPKRPDQYEIRPTFSYYSPDSAKYVLLRSKPTAVLIRPGSQSGSNYRPPVPQTSEEASLEDIRSIKLNHKTFSSHQSFWRSSIFWTLFMTPFVGLLGGLAYWWWNRSLEGIDPEVLKRRQARQQAMKRLEKAQQFMVQGKNRAFYDEISKAMLGYVSDKLRIPKSVMTKQNVQNKLQTLRVADRDVDDFMDIISATEMALFAGKDQSADMEAIYQQTLLVLAQIEEGVNANLKH